MARRHGNSRRTDRRPLSAKAPAAGHNDVQLAVWRLQDSAYANLRSAIANVAIFFGVIGVFAISVGAADGARLAPTLVGVLAGLLGGGYYAIRRCPRTALYLLATATLCVIVGVVWLVVAVKVLDR